MAGHRLFFALAPPPAVCAQLERATHALASSPRVTAGERLHVTLAFLGDFPEASDAPARAMAAAGITTLRCRIAGASRRSRRPSPNSRSRKPRSRAMSQANKAPSRTNNTAGMPKTQCTMPAALGKEWKSPVSALALYKYLTRWPSCGSPRA
jgi:2'-5' RNA ligase